MAIIAQNEYGFLICSKTYFDKIYSTVYRENYSELHFVLKESFYDIRSPFVTDSMAKRKADMILSPEIDKMKKHKIKKKSLQKNMIEYVEIDVFINKNLSEFINAGKKAGIFEDSEITPTEWFENNSKAREAAKVVMNCVNLALKLDLHFENTSSHSIIQKFGDEEYVIPAESKFHLCDISSFIEFTDEKFDVIVIDPPWINRSVKRISSYYSLKYELLKSVPFEKLANPGCLIVIWVTNSSSAASFILEELFPKCNVILSSMWHWCKITKKGNFIYPIESDHKKPYENLILGRVQYINESVKTFKEIDSKKLIVSVPSSIHSQKPPLTEILKPYVKKEASYLELFARYLLPGYTSVGDEVLKLQSTKLFDVTSSNT